MHDTRMQSPLHAHGLAAMAGPMDDTSEVWANEIPNLGYISLRGNPGDKAFVDAASRALGVALPVKACSFAQAGALKVLWLSPDEWMIVAPRMGHPQLLAALSAALKGIRSQVVDNSGGYTQIALLGRNATDVLSHVSVYDIAALEHGRVVGTTFGKSSVTLHREGSGYALLVRRSFADYIWRYLARAAAPYGFDVVSLDRAGTGKPPGEPS